MGQMTHEVKAPARGIARYLESSNCSFEKRLARKKRKKRSRYVNLLASWERIYTFYGTARHGIATPKRLTLPRNERNSSHEASKFTLIIRCRVLLLLVRQQKFSEAL